MSDYLRSFDPSNGKYIGEVIKTSEEEIRETVKRSAAAQEKWAELSIDERISILQNAGHALERKSREIGSLLAMEMGKSWRRAVGEVSGSANSIVYVA